MNIMKIKQVQNIVTKNIMYKPSLNLRGKIVIIVLSCEG